MKISKNELIGCLKTVTIIMAASSSVAMEVPDGGVQLWENGPYWAECNLGANNPEESGCYFKWGDTTGYKPEGGSWTDNYPDRGYSGVTWVTVGGRRLSESPFATSKGRGDSVLDASGNLKEEDDAATVNLGKPWRIPTDADFEGLVRNCRTSWTSRGGVPGLLVTGKGTYASKSIFLPAAGRGEGDWIHFYRPSTDGYYWASTTYPGSSILACDLAVWSDGASCGGRLRGYGQCIRPVWGGVKPDGGPYEELVDGVSWTFTVGGGKATVTGASPSTGLVEVPTKLGERPVVSIGSYAFRGCNGLLEMSIPSTVTTIGNGAFCECTELKQVSIPSAVCEIGFDAFAGCRLLSEIELPSSVTVLQQRVFSGCQSLKSITIPDGVEEIREGAFYGCSELETVVLPKSVVKIGKDVFGSCSSIRSVTIPSCVTSLYSTFKDSCSSIETVAYHDGVTSIARSAFNSCVALQEVILPQGVTNIGIQAFAGCRCLSSVVLPSSVVTIEENAFAGCAMVSFEIPEGVTSIGPYAFGGCAKLASIRIPALVVNIGGRVFEGCTSLTDITVDTQNSRYVAEGGLLLDKSRRTVLSCAGGLGQITIPASVMRIDSSAFRGSKLQRIEIPTTVSFVGAYAFKDCPELVSAVLSSGLHNLEEYTFDGCLELVSVEIAGGITNIGKNAFANCVSLKTVKIPSSVASIGMYAFGSSGLVELDLPVGVEMIGYGAFEECKDLTSLRLPLGVKRIDDYAFFHCEGLQSVEIPSSVLSIGSYSFAACGELTSVILHEGVRSLDRGAFSSCTKLGVFKFLTSITWVGSYAFSGCTELETLFVPSKITGAFSNGYTVFSGCSAVKTVHVEQDGLNSVKSALTRQGVPEGASYVADLKVSAISYENLEGASNDNSSSYVEGSAFEFASPGKRPGYAFKGWSPPAITVEMTGAQTVRANWEVKSYPELKPSATSADVKAALDGSADVRLAMNIMDAAIYGTYRAWAMKIGESDVVVSPFAWASFATDSAALLAKMPTDDDLKVEEFKPSATAGSFDFTVSVKDVTIGDKASEDNLKKLFGLEGAESLDSAAFSSEKVALDFKKPQDGKLKFTATPAVDNAKSFFMKVKIK